MIIKNIASSNEIPIFSQIDVEEKSAGLVSSSSSSARAPRNSKQELIFLLTCAEHVLFAPESQHVLMFRDWPQKQKKKKHDQDDEEEDHHAKLMMSFNSLLLAERNERQFDNVFVWIARYFTSTSKHEEQEEEDVDEDDEAILAQSLRVVFDSS